MSATGCETLFSSPPLRRLSVEIPPDRLGRATPYHKACNNGEFQHDRYILLAVPQRRPEQQYRQAV